MRSNPITKTRPNDAPPLSYKNNWIIWTFRGASVLKTIDKFLKGKIRVWRVESTHARGKSGEKVVQVVWDVVPCCLARVRVDEMDEMDETDGMLAMARSIEGCLFSWSYNGRMPPLY